MLPSAVMALAESRACRGLGQEWSFTMVGHLLRAQHNFSRRGGARMLARSRCRAHADSVKRGARAHANLASQR